MNKRLLLNVGATTSLLISVSAAMAAAPGGGGFGQYTANAGVITSTSIVGQTAAPVTLVSGNGFLQQKVTTAQGSFYRTIILDNNATATDGAGVTALGFKNETFTGSTSNSGMLASEGVVKLAAPVGTATAGSGSTSNVTLAGTTLATNSTVAILARGALATTGTIADIKSGAADATGIKILQAHDFSVDTSAGGVTATEVAGKSSSTQVNFTFLSQGEAAAQEDRSNYMRLDEYGSNGGFFPPNNITARRSSGDFTVGSGTLMTPDGQTLAYSAGDDISVTLTDTASLGGGTFGYPTTGTAVGNAGSVNANIQTQHFRNYTTDGKIDFVNSSQRQVATNGATIGGGLTGYPQVLFSPVVTATVASAWPTANWDTNFGTAPVVVVTNTTNLAADIAPTSMTQAFPN